MNAGLSIPEIRMLFEYYIKNKEEFDYLTFYNDVCSCIKSRIGNRSSSSTATINDTNSRSINENISPELMSVLYRIRALEIKKMLDLNDMFSSYDQMKNGTIPCKMVNSFFVNIGLLFKNKESDELIKYYQDTLNKEMFHYRTLLNNLSDIKIQKENIDRILYPQYVQEEMERELFSVRPEIKEKLHVRRKNVYTVYGNAKGSTMSEDEFFNRLYSAGIILIKPQRDALMKFYSNPATGEINYQRFCDDVENSSTI